MGEGSTRSIGAAAEAAAEAYLVEECGYRIVARNHYARGGELDLVAWDGDILCFVEVRARDTASDVDPLETITPNKIACIVRAAHDFLETQWSGPLPDQMRFDAVGVLLAPFSVRLVRGAFDTTGPIHG